MLQLITSRGLLNPPALAVEANRNELLQQQRWVFDILTTFKHLIFQLLNHTTPPAPRCPQGNLPFPEFKTTKNYLKHTIGIRPDFEGRDRLTGSGIG
jgi:hypothetical protein